MNKINNRYFGKCFFDFFRRILLRLEKDERGKISVSDENLEKLKPKKGDNIQVNWRKKYSR